MNAYLYRCVTSASSCTLNSTAATLTVNTAPAVVTQPVTTTLVCVGQTIVISTTASGTAVTYQWQLSTDGGTTYNNITNGGVYGGATTATLTITGVVATMDTYKYRCVLSGTCTPAATTNASTINISTPVTVSTQPVNTAVCANNTANFSVTATGTVTAYQWQVSTFLVPAFTNIPGATASSYSTAVNYTMNGNRYQCIITSVCTGNITSNPATLTVNQNPVITLVATPTTALYPGLTATISIANISPAAGVTYVWRKNGVIIPGATGTSISVGIDDFGIYTVTVTDVNGCTAVSNNIVINQIDARKLFIYPNPSSGKFQVRLYNTPGVTNTYKINIYDSKGSKVFSQAYPISGAYDRMDVNLVNASSGVYVVMIVDFITGGQVAVGKVMIY